MWDLAQPVSSALLALITTVHLALALLRQHRSARSLRHVPVLLPSMSLTVFPWLFPAAFWLVAGVLAHLAWFAACERMLPRQAAQRQTAVVTEVATLAPVTPQQRSGSAAPRPAAFQPVTVLAVIEETEDIKTFRLSRPPGFSFLPGQFLNVRQQVNGEPQVRCYSISSAPESAGYLEISVKRQGLVSGLLHATVRPGASLTIKGPAGRFTYPDADDRPLVLVAGGVGITPLASMLRHAVAAEPMRPVTLLYSVRGDHDVAFRDELLWLARRHPQMMLCITLSRGSAPGFLSGRIDEPLLRAQVCSLRDSVFMICGPQPMIAATKDALHRLEVAAENVRSEAFEAAVAAAREPRELPAAGASATSARAGAATFRLTLLKSHRTVPAGKRQTLLEAAEAGGASLPSSCRAGVCLTCRCRVIEGEVDCSTDSLDPSERNQGYVLPCVSWAKSDCVLEA